MNNHHDIDVYATPSISVLGSLAELTQVRPNNGASSAWEDDSRPG